MVKDRCLFHNGRVVLHPDLASVPKISSVFHRSEGINLSFLCPNSKHDKEKEWHCLDVKQALSYFMERTKPFRKMDSLFVYFRKQSLRKGVSDSILSRWVTGCIILAYQVSSLEVPQGIMAHSKGSSHFCSIQSFSLLRDNL